MTQLSPERDALTDLAPPRPFSEDAHHINARQYAAPGEESPEATFRRVARFVARGNPERAATYEQLMIGRRFCPGGRVLAGADTTHNNVLNCFVQEATAHQPGTYAAVEELQLKLALVTKVGGGNGVNLDPYPPRQTVTPTTHVLHAYLSADHPDVAHFVTGTVRNKHGAYETLPPSTWTHVTRRVLHSGHVPDELRALCEANGVPLLSQAQADLSHPDRLSVPDDLSGIIRAAQQVARTLDTGHAAADFTPMRPEGAPINGSGGTSSGPVSFLHEIFANMVTWVNLGALSGGPINVLRYVYAPALRVVRQGGTRRGAGMATISIGHPDVLDFLTAKDLDREAREGDIGTFNISILVSGAFWDTLQAGGLWPVSPRDVPGKYYLAPQTSPFTGALPTLPTRGDAQGVPMYTEQGPPSMPAQWLWEQIAHHAWSTGEPGLIFIDRVNEYSALKNLGETYQIRSTNPCLAPGTLVSYREVGSDDGPHAAPVESLLSRDVEVIDGVTGRWHRTRFRVTGRNEVVWNLETDHGGTEYATPYHTFFLADGAAVQLRELEVGQQLQAGNGTLFTVQAVGSEARTEAEVYCCTVEPHHRFSLASGLQSGNCGEIPLTVGEPCDLGAINLGAYVKGGTFNEVAFRRDVATCVEFLDDVLDVNAFALDDNRVASQQLRRVGLGIMGLADMLIKLNLPYSSAQGRDAVRHVLSILRDEAILTSERLGLARGVYPAYAAHNTFSGAGESLTYDGPIPHAPRRNVALLTVAPTGTTSMLMDASSGIEPIYSPFVYRLIGGEQRTMVNDLLLQTLKDYPAPQRLQAPDGSWDEDKTTAALKDSGGSLRHDATADFPEEVKRIFEFAHDIAPEDHIRMQGVIQRTFDAHGLAGNSLSKTINLPRHATVHDVMTAYHLAYTEGCKGVTVYRDGSRQFQPLNTTDTSAADPLLTRSPEELVALLRESQERAAQLQFELDSLNVASPAPVTYSAEQFTRRSVLHGHTVHVKLSSRETNRMTSFLVVINHDQDTHLPIEVILVGGSSGEEAHADSEALGKLASKTLQAGVNPRIVIRSLKDTEGGLNGYAQFSNDPDARRVLITSKAQLIAHALEAALAQRPSDPHAPTVRSSPAREPTGEKDCPACQGRRTVVFVEGCEKCLACGAGKCS